MYWYCFPGMLTNAFLIPTPPALLDIDAPRYMIIKPLQRHLYIPGDQTDESDNTVTMMFHNPLQVKYCLLLLRICGNQGLYNDTLYTYMISLKLFIPSPMKLRRDIVMLPSIRSSVTSL